MDTGIHSLNHSIEQAQHWISSYSEQVGEQSKDTSFAAMKAAMAILRDRLPASEVADLASHIPPVLRGYFYDGYKPEKHHHKAKSKEDLVVLMREKLESMRVADVDAEKALDAFKDLLIQRITEGDIKHVKGSLPEHLKDWFAADVLSQEVKH